MNWFTQKVMGFFGKNDTVENDTTEATSDTLDYNNMKVAELKAIAKEKGIKGYYKLKKAELVSALSDESQKKEKSKTVEVY